MNDLNRVQLVEVASIKGGKRLPLGEDFSKKETSHPYIRARDIGYGKIEIHDPVFLCEEMAQKLSRYRVTTGDICITIVGANVGEMGVVPPELNGANLTENAVRITSNGKVDQTFLKFALFSEDAFAQMKILAGGAAQPKLGIYKIESIEIPLPTLPTQQKIASILSTYDDLIENNTRRIKILEEMAQTLYREWLVHFRYPGYESVPLVESELGLIPEGWEVRCFSDIGSFINGYAFKPSDWGKEGLPIIKIVELKNGITGNTPFNSGAGIDQKYIIDSGDILFSWSADLNVYVWGFGKGILNQHLFNVIPKPNHTKLFLYYSLHEKMPLFRNMSLGTTMRHIKRSALDQIFTLVPPQELEIEFENNAKPIHELIINLINQNSNLRQQRDLLLPHLISGELDVDGIKLNQ